MIRQAISCDICGAEKMQTNHWFVVDIHGDELRITRWNTNSRLRANSKHLCGQTCLHKLVDEFIAGRAASRTIQSASQETLVEPLAGSDISLTSSAAYAEPLPSARALVTPAPPHRPAAIIPAAVIAITPSRTAEELRPRVATPVADESPTYTSRRWRAEAWERERERERHSALANHRKTL